MKKLFGVLLVLSALLSCQTKSENEKQNENGKQSESESGREEHLEVNSTDETQPSPSNNTEEAIENKVWSSSVRNASITYPSIWEMSKTPIDNAQKTMMGLVQASKDLTFILKIVEDVPQDEVSDEKLYYKTQKAMLFSNRKNLLLEEIEESIQSLDFHKMSFLMNTKEGKQLQHQTFIHRNGKDMITLQCVYPATESHEKELPEVFQNLIDQLSFDAPSKDSKS